MVEVLSAKKQLTKLLLLYFSVQVFFPFDDVKKLPDLNQTDTGYVLLRIINEMLLDRISISDRFDWNNLQQLEFPRDWIATDLQIIFPSFPQILGFYIQFFFGNLKKKIERLFRSFSVLSKVDNNLTNKNFSCLHLKHFT
jgi:hypothetical protein